MAILTLAQAKDHLNIPLNNTSYDEELLSFIAATDALVERHLGGPAVNRTVTETVRPAGYGDTLVLAKGPVVSLTSAAANGSTISLTDAYVSSGRVVRRQNGAAFSPLTPPITVTYVAGLGATAPPAVVLAAKIIVAHLWSTQRGSVNGGPSGPNDEYGSINTVTPGLGYAVPNRALQLLDAYAPETGLA